MQPKEALQTKVVKTKSTIKEQPQNLDSHHMDTEHEREKPNELSRNRHGRGWKSLVKDAVETPPLRSVVTANIHVDEDAHMGNIHLKRSSPPRPIVQRKRRRPDEKLHIKVYFNFLWNFFCPIQFYFFYCFAYIVCTSASWSQFFCVQEMINKESVSHSTCYICLI